MRALSHLTVLLISQFVITTSLCTENVQTYSKELLSLWLRPEFACITKPGIAANTVMLVELEETVKNTEYARLCYSGGAAHVFAALIKSQTAPALQSPVSIPLRPQLTPQIFELVSTAAKELGIPMPIVCAVHGAGPAAFVTGILHKSAILFINTQTAALYSDRAFEAVVIKALVEVAQYAQIKKYATIGGVTMATGTLTAGLFYALAQKYPITESREMLRVVSSCTYISLVTGYLLGTKLNVRRDIEHEKMAAEICGKDHVLERITSDAHILATEQQVQADMLEKYLAHTIVSVETQDTLQIGAGASSLRSTKPVEPTGMPTINARRTAISSLGI